MIVSRSYPHDVRPATHVALPIFVVPQRNNCAIKPESKYVVMARGDHGHHLKSCCLAQVPLGKLDLGPCHDHCAILSEPNRVIMARSNLGNVLPLSNLKLPPPVVPYSDYGTVGS